MMTREQLLEEKEYGEKKEKRKKRGIIFLICFILFIALLLLYSRFIATSGLVIREYKVANEHLPQDFYGFKIVQFSDLHYGSTVFKKDLEKIVQKVNELKPDLLVFTGDLIDQDTKITEALKTELTDLLKEMKAKVGKYAVSGNHDYVYEGFEKIIKEAGFNYLDNAYDLIYYQGYQPILITGMSDSGQFQNDIDKAFAYFKDEEAIEDIYTIALFHEPDDITSILAKYPVDLALSGHSHNGQVRLPFLPPLATIRGAKKYNDEYYKVDKTDLYISGGLGTSHYKFRLFNRPSINFYRLVKES